MSGRPRTFDYAEAKRRYRAGERVTALASEYGVSDQSVYRALNDAYRLRCDKRVARLLRNRRMPCRGGCGKLVWDRFNSPTATGYCRSCLGDSRRTVLHGTEKEYVRWGCRCELCTRAASAAKRARRHKSRVPCSHGCGALVDSINRKDADKPYECSKCSRDRILGRLKVAA